MLPPLKSPIFTPETNAVGGRGGGGLLLYLSRLGLRTLCLSLLLTQFHGHTSLLTSQSPDLTWKISVFRAGNS